MKFSVIIPAYNRAELLGETLDSVLAQTLTDWEIIVVDDGSTDDTAATAKAYGQEHTLDEDRFRVISKPNGGVCSARNAGIARARGKYVQFLDSDDVIYPDRLDRLWSVMEREGADFALTGFEGFKGAPGNVMARHGVAREQSQHDRALRGRFWGNSLRCAYRSDLVKRIGPWDEDFDCFEDREYSERALFAANCVVAIPDMLAGARREGERRLSDQLRTKRGRGLRIECERRLLNAALSTGKGSQEALSAFASRIYALGFRSNAEGWTEHGRACGELARRVPAPLDSLGLRRRLVWHMGPAGGWAYVVVAEVFKRIQASRSSSD